MQLLNLKADVISMLRRILERNFEYDEESLLFFENLFVKKKYLSCLSSYHIHY